MRLLMVDYKAWKSHDKLYGLKPYWQNDRALFSAHRILVVNNTFTGCTCMDFTGNHWRSFISRTIRKLNKQS
jgi:hypothetical protein